MDRKADKHDLREMEANYNDQLNEMVGKLSSMFADKNDTKRRISNIEKNVKLF